MNVFIILVVLLIVVLLLILSGLGVVIGRCKQEVIELERNHLLEVQAIRRSYQEEYRLFEDYKKFYELTQEEKNHEGQLDLEKYKRITESKIKESQRGN